MTSHTPELAREVDCAAALSAAEQTVAGNTPLRREVLLEWMRSPCVDVQSVAFAVLFDPPAGTEPPDTETVNQFFLDYLARRLRDGTGTSRTPGRFLAAQLIRAWFQRLWRTGLRPEDLLARIRDLLGRLLRSGDEQVHDAVLLGVLEHLFVEPSIVEFFSGWRQDPALRPVFLEALALTDADRLPSAKFADDPD